MLRLRIEMDNDEARKIKKAAPIARAPGAAFISCYDRLISREGHLN